MLDLGPVVVVEGEGDEESTGDEHMKKIPISPYLSKFKTSVNDHQSLKWRDQHKKTKKLQK